MKKSRIFKKFLAATLASTTICSTGISKCEAYRPTSTTEAVVAVTALTVGTVAIVAGGTATIALTVHTGNVSTEICEKETKIATLKADISRLEAKIKNTPDSNVYCLIKLREELAQLQHQLSMEKIRLANLKMDYRDSCQDLYWQERNLHDIQHIVHNI